MTIPPIKEEPIEKDLKQQFDFLMESARYNFEIIQYLDQKTHLLIGTIGLLIPLTLVLYGDIDFSLNTPQVTLGIVGYSLTILILFVSLLFAFNVVIARIVSVPKTLFFGLDIIKESREIFKQKITTLTLEQQISNISDLTYNSGSIMQKKFYSYNISVVFLVISVELLISSFVGSKVGYSAIIFFFFLMIINGGLFLLIYRREKGTSKNINKERLTLNKKTGS